jgi:hypothetical protein
MQPEAREARVDSGCGAGCQQQVLTRVRGECFHALLPGARWTARWSCTHTHIRTLPGDQSCPVDGETRASCMPCGNERTGFYSKNERY